MNLSETVFWVVNCKVMYSGDGIVVCLAKEYVYFYFLLLSLLFVEEMKVFISQYVKRNFQDFIPCVVIFKVGSPTI